MLDWWFRGLPDDWWKDSREKWSESRERRGLASCFVCFRSVLRDYPFISTHTLESVATRGDVNRDLSCWDLQTLWGDPVFVGLKCLSGLTDNTFTDLCLCRDPCTAAYVWQRPDSSYDTLYTLTRRSANSAACFRFRQIKKVILNVVNCQHGCSYLTVN